MHDPTIGGRGRRAPYSTKLTRVPEPIKPIVENFSQHYKELVMEYADPEDPELIKRSIIATVPGAFVTPPRSEQYHELEMAQQKIEALRAAVEHLHEKLAQRDQVLTEALKIHSSHGTTIKRKIKKALEI